jgi:hypothetical protein
LVKSYSTNIHCKKRSAIFPPPAGMSLSKLSLDGNNLIVLDQGELLVSDIPGDGKTANLFVTVCSVFGLRHRPCTCATGCLAVGFHFPFLLPIYVFLPVASIWLYEYSLLAPSVRERIEVQYIERKSRIYTNVLHNSPPIDS